MAKVHLFIICKKLDFLGQESGFSILGSCMVYRRFWFSWWRGWCKRGNAFQMQGQTAARGRESTEHCVFAPTQTLAWRERRWQLASAPHRLDGPVEEGHRPCLLDFSPGPGLSASGKSEQTPIHTSRMELSLLGRGKKNFRRSCSCFRQPSQPPFVKWFKFLLFKKWKLLVLSSTSAYLPLKKLSLCISSCLCLYYYWTTGLCFSVMSCGNRTGLGVEHQ